MKGTYVLLAVVECEKDEDCADSRFCDPETKTCENPCVKKHCGVNAICNASNHQAVCVCPSGTTGNPEVFCSE